MRPNVAKGLSLYKNGRANGAPIHSIPFSPPDPNDRVVTEPRGRAQGLASQ